jgi:hypothetical protein
MPEALYSSGNWVPVFGSVDVATYIVLNQLSEGKDTSCRDTNF